MTHEERLKNIANKLAQREAGKQAVVNERKDKGGAKKLTITQRIEYLEKILGITD